MRTIVGAIDTPKNHVDNPPGVLLLALIQPEMCTARALDKLHRPAQDAMLLTRLVAILNRGSYRGGSDATPTPADPAPPLR